MRRRFTDDEIETIRINYADWPTFLIAYLVDHPVSSVYQQAWKLGLRKSEKFLASKWVRRLRGGEDVGKAYRFPKGNVPANKGKRRPGWSPGRMSETQFKKGDRCGQAARNWMPIGTEVADADGYLKRKVREDAPPNRGQLNWAFVHVLLWEEHLGPVPPKHNIVFKNRDKTDIRIDNLACISRAENMRRNSYHTRYPKEIGLAIQARSALVRSINRRARIARGEPMGKKQA